MKTINFRILLIILISIFSTNVAKSQCTASFTYIDNGNGNFSFTNTSGSGLDYYWNFDGLSGSYPPGATSTIENPTYTYSNPGTYYASLSIYDSITNCYDSIAQQIEYVMDTTCNITAGFTFVDNGNGDFSFTNTSVGGNYYSWNFGDSLTSTTVNPNHTFTANGTYQICMTVFDTNSSCSDNICQTITVTGVPNPFCNYSVNAVEVRANVFMFNIPQQGASYTWDFGDGNTLTTTSGNSNFHAYTSNGTYQYCLTIDNCPPVCDSLVVDLCDFYVSTDTDSSGVTHFDSNAPYPASYFWDFGDGNTSTIAIPYYTYSAPGTYYYCLTVDSCPTVCDSVVIDACNVYAFFSTYNFGNGNYAFYNYSGGSALNGLSAYWNFGDGNTSNTYDANHTYTTNGTYVVVLAVMDSTVYGTCMDYFTATITITDATSPVTCNAAFVMYTDSSYNGVIVVNSSTGNNLSYFWDFGDGNTSTQAYPNYTYSTAGPFYLCLTVTGDSSCTSTYCDSIGAGGVVWKTNGFSINVVSPSSTLSVNEKQEVFTDLNVYPNPAKELLNIELNLVKNETIELFVTDIAGRVVAQIANNENQVGKQKYQWNVGGLQNGVYLLNIKSDNNIQVKKVLINR